MSQQELAHHETNDHETPNDTNKETHRQYEHRDFRTRRVPSTRNNSARSTPTGGPPITCPSARSISVTIRCFESRSKLEHVKQLLLGHWGTTPGQNFIYAHLNRIIKQHDLNMIYVSGPGHGAPGGGGQRLPRRHVQRGLSQHQPGRGRAEKTVPAVFLSRRDFQSRFTADAGIDS